MNCRHCGSELPRGAMFCGECGRAVSMTATPTGVVCPQCATPVGEHDVFCGSCGFLVANLPVPTGRVEPAPVNAVDAVDAVGQVDGEETAAPVAPMNSPDEAGEVAAPGPQREWRPTASAPRAPGAADGLAPVSAAPAPPAAAPPPPAPPILPPPALPRPATPGAELPEDVERTRLVDRSAAAGERFVLQFSTGESVTVSGSGLIGRNPAAEPGEYVDQTVSVFDAGKSVSKTHLEFGQEAGRFWVSDRFSTNGSVVRAPDSPPRRCEPGRRYLISRGTRVDIGEQFFVVS